ncbi:hypothetical protein [Gimesia aquarii]|uniref:hypothetical protein n=1 Tax=Gimesia aquarii TaxID=2527964 RepID=UPI0011A0B6BE|nr:hypothetical protein [Gimesia aquarii]
MAKTKSVIYPYVLRIVSKNHPFRKIEYIKDVSAAVYQRRALSPISNAAQIEGKIEFLRNSSNAGQQTKTNVFGICGCLQSALDDESDALSAFT